MRTRRHKLMDIVVIGAMAVICIADGWDEIVLYAKQREEWLRTFLELPNGIACADTDGKLAAIDGKTVRHSFWICGKPDLLLGAEIG